MSEVSTDNLALRVHMMPKHTNAFGTIFGGVILSLIDQAGFDEARRKGLHRWVTVAFDQIEFQKPVFVGDVVSLYTKTLEAGTSSLKIGITVFADRYNSKETVQVTSGSLTMVSVNEHGKPIPSSSPPTLTAIRNDTT